MVSLQYLAQETTLLQAEHSRMLGSQYQLEKDLEKLEAEKAELLEDNQRMASLIASSDGDRKEVGGLLERLSEERKSFQRQVEQFKDRGWSDWVEWVGWSGGVVGWGGVGWSGEVGWSGGVG